MAKDKTLKQEVQKAVEFGMEVVSARRESLLAQIRELKEKLAQKEEELASLEGEVRAALKEAVAGLGIELGTAPPQPTAESRTRRGKDQTEADRAALVDLLKGKRLRIADIAAQTGRDAAHLRPDLQALVKAGKVKTAGNRRTLTYTA